MLFDEEFPCMVRLATLAAVIVLSKHMVTCQKHHVVTELEGCTQPQNDGVICIVQVHVCILIIIALLVP